MSALGPDTLDDGDCHASMKLTDDHCANLADIEATLRSLNAKGAEFAGHPKLIRCVDGICSH